MHYIDKRPLVASLLAAIAYVFCACSSDSPEIASPEMRFVAADASRSIVSGINYEGSCFAIFGDMKFSTSSPVKVFHNVEVKYDGSAWNYAGAQYWFPDHEHSFVAVYPAKALENIGEHQYSESKLSFEYALPIVDDATLDKDETLDLLFATHRRMYKSGDDGTVSFKFDHLMSLVNLAPAFSDNKMGDEDYILIHELVLSGINTKAQFDIVPAPRLSASQTNDYVVDMTAQAPGNPVVTFAKPVKIKNQEGNLKLFANEEALIMIPQAFSAEADAQIVLSYSVNEETTMKQVSLPLGNQNWLSGRSYIYNFTIERTGLKFDNCEINPWSEIKGDNIIVD